MCQSVTQCLAFRNTILMWLNKIMHLGKVWPSCDYDVQLSNGSHHLIQTSQVNDRTSPFVTIPLVRIISCMLKYHLLMCLIKCSQVTCMCKQINDYILSHKVCSSVQFYMYWKTIKSRQETTAQAKKGPSGTCDGCTDSHAFPHPLDWKPGRISEGISATPACCILLALIGASISCRVNPRGYTVTVL